MQLGNIYAQERLDTPTGRRIHYLKGCYQCGTRFIALREDALACSHNCGTSIVRKLKGGQDLSGKFKIGEIGNEVELEEYPKWQRHSY